VLCHAHRSANATLPRGLFDKRSYKGALPQSYSIIPPAADQTVTATLPAYHAYLSSAGYSKYTPDDFRADIKCFGQFTGSKLLQDIQTVDIQQWISELKKTMPPKTVSRKVSALGNYFRWLEAEKVLAPNPAKNIRAPRDHGSSFPVHDRADDPTRTTAVEGSAWDIGVPLDDRAVDVPDVHDRPSGQASDEGHTAVESPLRALTWDHVTCTKGSSTSGARPGREATPRHPSPDARSYSPSEP
jgi:Phage integrase, N-terminal SAM-like domain